MAIKSRNPELTAAIIRTVKLLRSRGTSFKEIAQELNTDGVLTPNGKLWSTGNLTKFFTTNENIKSTGPIKRKYKRKPKLIPIPDLGPQKSTQPLFMFFGTPEALKAVAESLS